MGDVIDFEKHREEKKTGKSSNWVEAISCGGCGGTDFNLVKDQGCVVCTNCYTMVDGILWAWVGRAFDRGDEDEDDSE